MVGGGVSQTDHAAGWVNLVLAKSGKGYSADNICLSVSTVTY